jgi:hypothetical protein
MIMMVTEAINNLVDCWRKTKKKQTKRIFGGRRPKTPGYFELRLQKCQKKAITEFAPKSSKSEFGRRVERNSELPITYFFEGSEMSKKAKISSQMEESFSQKREYGSDVESAKL